MRATAALRDDYGIGMTEDRLDWHLWNWSNWHFASKGAERAALGYPGSVAVIGISHGQWSHGSDFDSKLAEVDRRCAEAVESALDDCTVAERCAVHHVHLHAVYRVRIGLDEAYASARVRIAAGLDARGIL